MEKRILIYTNHFYPENFKINDVVNWISELNCHVRVITQIPNYPSGKFFKGYGFFKNTYQNKDKKIVNRLAVIPRGNGRKINLILNYISFFISCFFFTLFIILTKRKYDYILVHHTSPPFISIFPIIYNLFYKTKKIYWELDIWPETLYSLNIIKSNMINGIIRKAMTIIYSNYDKILISSRGFNKIIRSRYNGDIEYFPNWADQLIEENLDTFKARLNIPDDYKILMYTGNIGFAQNFEFILKLCENTIDQKIYWVLIGDGRFRKNIENKIKLNQSLKIKILDPVKTEKISSYLNLADFSILSLKFKGIFRNTVPAKLQTYMCLSKPIIGIIDGEAKDIILEANCGIILDSNKIKESTTKLLKMINEDHETIRTLGHNGKKYYEKIFSTEMRKKQIFKLIK